MLFDSLGNDLNISDRPEVMGPKSSLRITIVRRRRGIREAPSAPSSRQTTTRVALCPFPPSQWKTWMTLSEFGWENRPCSPRVSVQTVAWNSDKKHLIRDVPWLVLGHNSTLAARLLRLATWGYCQTMRTLIQTLKSSPTIQKISTKNSWMSLWWNVPTCMLQAWVPTTRDLFDWLMTHAISKINQPVVVKSTKWILTVNGFPQWAWTLFTAVHFWRPRPWNNRAEGVPSWTYLISPVPKRGFITFEGQKSTLNEVPQEWQRQSARNGF